MCHSPGMAPVPKVMALPAVRGWRGSELTWKVRHLSFLVLQGDHVVAGVLSLILAVEYKVNLQVLYLDTIITSQNWGVHISIQHPGVTRLVVAVFTEHPTCPSMFY